MTRLTTSFLATCREEECRRSRQLQAALDENREALRRSSDEVRRLHDQLSCLSQLNEELGRRLQSEKGAGVARLGAAPEPGSAQSQ